MQTKYPFKFLDAYQRDDKDFFFGREQEIKNLYEMVFQTRIVVVYGASGTGKTSLIQCGLANKFQSYDWLDLYVRRGTNIIAALDRILCEESDGAFVYPEEVCPEGVCPVGVSPGIEHLEKKIEAVYKEYSKPIYLIFDQFEELYVQDRNTSKVQEQQQFVQVIKDLLQLDFPLKIILSIREEYLGHLFHFEREVPELLRKKLRVEPMDLEKVKTVIKGVGNQPQSNVQLQAGQEDAIAETIFNKVRGEDPSLYIELPYLQVFLDKLYLQITHDQQRVANAVFTMEELEKMGDINNLLRDFLDEQVVTIAQQFNTEPKTIWHILSPFVSIEDTKVPLSQLDLLKTLEGTDPVLINKILAAFVKSQLLRFIQKKQLYELAHDALAKQISARRSEDEIGLLQVQHLIKSQIKLKPENRAYFQGNQLDLIVHYLENGMLTLSPEEEDFVEKSREIEFLRKNEELEKQMHEVERARAQAEYDRRLRQEAEEQKRMAEEQKNIAVKNEKQARMLARVATLLAVFAIIFGMIAYKAKQEASVNLLKKNSALDQAYKADIARLNSQKNNTEKNLQLLQQYHADDDVLQLEQRKIDSFSREITDREKVQNELKK